MLSRIALVCAALTCGCSAAVDRPVPTPVDEPPPDAGLCVTDDDCPPLIGGCSAPRCAPESPDARESGCEYVPTPDAACTRYVGGVPAGAGVCLDADDDGDLQCHDVSPI